MGAAPLAEAAHAVLGKIQLDLVDDGDDDPVQTQEVVDVLPSLWARTHLHDPIELDHGSGRNQRRRARTQ